MKERWFVKTKGGDFQAIGEKFQISPMVARIMRNREVIGDSAVEQYLHGSIADLYDGMLLKDMNTAIEILCEKIKEKKRIRIIGDYDIDGVNATYILLDGLGKLGALVDSDIPDRIKDGYGLNIELVERAIGDGIDTIITCDNGIAAREEISYAKQCGITVIVTDHHEIPYEEVAKEEGFERQYLMPEADAVVDPKREDCLYPFKGLCGAGVAYKLVEAMFHALDQDVEDVDYLMENVAIATIGDVMDLVDENRIFVKQGLDMLKQTNNLGLKALMELTQVDLEHLSPYHIGFVVGPCINAGGRLDTAKRSLELLLAKTKKEAEILAFDLKALNDSRKELTQKGLDEAIEQVERFYSKDHVLVVYLKDCHESLAGIIAGRLREKYYRPSFVLTDADQGAKGSGRSIESYHMYEELNKCKELLTKYGGHKLAAGLSLKQENIQRFRATLNQLSNLSEEQLIPKVSIDMQLPLGYITETFVEELGVLEPFGKGNEKPLFVEKNLLVTEHRILGQNRNVLKMKVKDEQGVVLEAICFRNIEELLALVKDKKKECMAFTFYPSINEFRGIKTLQLVIENFQ